MLDRQKALPMLLKLAGAAAHTSGGLQPRGEQLEHLLAQCQSELERRFLRVLDAKGLRLPDYAQRLMPGSGTRPDFYYDLGQTCVYVDGPYHEYPERQKRDAEVTARLEDGGYTVVRFADPEGWDKILGDYAWIFGEGKS
jgi:very-short-patch-repair endonuclease